MMLTLLLVAAVWVCWGVGYIVGSILLDIWLRRSDHA
jgi:hypothetical protein